MVATIYTIGENYVDQESQHTLTDNGITDTRWKYTLSGMFGCGTKERKYQDFMRDENMVIIHCLGSLYGIVVYTGELLRVYLRGSEDRSHGFASPYATSYLLFWATTANSARYCHSTQFIFMMHASS
jgi:hypothetical protein